MSEVTSYDRSSGTAGGALVAFGLSAAIAAGNVSWPISSDRAYFAGHIRSTHSPMVRVSPVPTSYCAEQELLREVADIYRQLLGSQEPLGAELEAIWDANIQSLYEA